MSQIPDEEDVRFALAAKVLPDEVLQQIQHLPPEQARDILQALMQQSSIVHQSLTPRHAKYIQVSGCWVGKPRECTRENVLNPQFHGCIHVDFPFRGCGHPAQAVVLHHYTLTES